MFVNKWREMWEKNEHIRRKSFSVKGILCEKRKCYIIVQMRGKKMDMLQK